MRAWDMFLTARGVSRHNADDGPATHATPRATLQGSACAVAQPVEQEIDSVRCGYCPGCRYDSGPRTRLDSACINADPAYACMLALMLIRGACTLGRV